MTEVSPRRRNILIYLCLALVTVAVYWPVRHFEFSNYDDPLYVTENQHLQRGLTLRGLGWAFTTPLDQWMPVTWLARILECQLFGLNAGIHHVVNVLFHIANALLLFGILNRMTGAPWRSALAAALFALHPLHVESVAWVTGLKDVLSTCLGLLTIWAYVRYTEEFTVQPFDKPRAGGSRRKAFYGVTLLFYALALMGKPMMVTLPFVLLLLDYWPLGRTRWAKPAPIRSGPAVGESVRRSPGQLLKEKCLFFALAAAACVVTYWAQHSLGVVPSLEWFSLETRIANALLSYVRYVGKTLWPTGLAVFYPLDPNLSLAAAMVAGVGLVGMTAAVIWQARRAPWLATGWFWYLGTLVPVIGLVQVGSQSMADRYTYVPLVGLFMMVCWSVPWGASQGRILKVIICVAAGTVLAVCAVLSRMQIGHWKDSETLFRHALNVTRDNWLAHYNLGVALEQLGKLDDAIGHYEQALRIRHDYAEAANNLGGDLVRLGRVQEAIGLYRRALQFRPDYARAHYNLGIALRQAGQVQEAISEYEQAVRFKPDYAEAYNNWGNALWQENKFEDAVRNYQQALHFKPDFAEAHSNLGVALVRLGRMPEAIGHFELALRIKPDYVEAHYNLGGALARLGRSQEAIAHYEQALRIKPDYAEVHNDFGNVLLQGDKVQDAIKHYEQALRLKPDYAEVQNNLAWLLATLAPAEGGDPTRAVTLAERACEFTGNRAPAYLDTLAAAYAAAGRFTDAIATAEKALEMAHSTGRLPVEQEIAAHLKLYRSGQAYRRAVVARDLQKR